MLDKNLKWNDFINKVNDLVKRLTDELNDVNKKINLIEGIKNILNSNDTIELLNNKDIILSIDISLKDYFRALGFLKENNNLDNDIVINILDNIKDSPSLKKFINSYEDLIDKSVDIETRLEEYTFFIENDELDIDTITKLCNELGLDNKDTCDILLYPIYNTLNIHSLSLNTKEKEEDTPSSIVVQELNVKEDTLEEKIDSLREYYNMLCNTFNPLLDKYRYLIDDMSSEERAYYEAFTYVTKNIYSVSNYPNAQVKVGILKLIKLRNDIEELFKVKNSFDVEKVISLLEKYLENFCYYGNTLINLTKDIGIQRKEENTVKNSRVYFLTDNDGNPFITDDIRKNYLDNILLIIDKEDKNRYLTDKHGSIMPIPLPDNLSKSLDKKVFSFREVGKAKKIGLSYIKLKQNDGKDAIMFLSAHTVKQDGIKPLNNETIKLIRDNLDLILKKIKLLEEKDQKELLMQECLKTNLFDTSILKEGEENGTKLK